MKEPPPRRWLLWAKHGFRHGDEMGADHRGQLWPNPTSPRLKSPRAAKRTDLPRLAPTRPSPGPPADHRSRDSIPGGSVLPPEGPGSEPFPPWV